ASFTDSRSPTPAWDGRRPCRCCANWPPRRARAGQAEMFHLADGAALLEMSNQEALDLAAALAESPPPGFLDAVPGARTLLLLFDPDRIEPESLVMPAGGSRRQSKTIRIPTVYDGADLEALGLP